MLRGLRGHFEKHHHVEIADDALQAAIEHSAAAMPGRRLPDRAVDLLDEACAMLRLTHELPSTPDLDAIHAELLAAEHTFDLEAVARIKFRVLPALRLASRPRLTADAVALACSTPA